MERLKFVKFSVLTNNRRKDVHNFFDSAYKAIHTGTQGLASALRRSTSAHNCKLREDNRLSLPPSASNEVNVENETTTIEEKEENYSLHSNDIQCTMAEYGWGLSDSTLRKASEELREDPSKRMQAIEAVRAHIPSRPDIDFHRTDDVFILRFLRARKFNVGAAFRLYCRYFEYRKANPTLFKNFTASEPGVKQALLDGFPGVLGTSDQHGHKVLILFTANWDHNRYGLLAIYRALLLTLETLVGGEEAQINGFVLIIDWSGFTFRQSSFLQPKLLRLIIEGLQDCFPGRFAGIHFVNQPWYIEAALTLIKSFLKEKTKDKIYLHGNNLTTLHHHITKEILPAELGGSGPPYNTETWAKQLLEDERITFPEQNICWTENANERTIDSKSRERSPVHSETFPSDLCKSQCPGRPSVTELDDEFFLNE